MGNFFSHRDTCRACHGKDVSVVLPLQPLQVATPNIGSTDSESVEALAQALVPLDLYRCAGCGHLQLLDIINPSVHYDNFSYRTSISLGLTQHFERLATTVIDQLQLSSSDLVVEIGSNDGTLLRFFQNKGMNVLGIDPARAIARAATSEGIETIADFFTLDLAKQIRAKHGPAAVVLCNNTFANLDDLDGPIAGIEHLLADDGVMVFETQHGADVIERFLIDTIYHEHLSYFLAGSLKELFARTGMDLFALEPIGMKGGSIRGFVQKTGGARQPDGSLDKIIAAEAAQGLEDPVTYEAFMRRLKGIKTDLRALIEKALSAGQRVAGYGASVGSVTMINQLGLGNVLAMIADDKPLGEAIVGPDYIIPIVSPDALSQSDIDWVIILAWRYAEPIIRNNQALLENGMKFIQPLPALHIHEGAS